MSPCAHLVTEGDAARECVGILRASRFIRREYLIGFFATQLAP
jgi:hypothetical protein